MKYILLPIFLFGITNSFSSETLDTNNIERELNSIIKFMEENIDPAISIIDREKLHSHITSIDIDSIGGSGCSSFATKMAAELLQRGLTDNHQQCSFFFLSVSILGIKSSIQALSECMTQTCDTLNLSLKMGRLMSESFRIKQEATNCLSWVRQYANSEPNHALNSQATPTVTPQCGTH